MHEKILEDKRVYKENSQTCWRPPGSNAWPSGGLGAAPSRALAAVQE